MKNKIFSIILLLMLMHPVVAVEEELPSIETLDWLKQDSVEEVVDVKSSESESIQYKQPISKKKLAKKFLLAMGGVGVSALLLLLILKIFKKTPVGVALSQENAYSDADKSLYTPDNYNSAVKIFIEKTKWTN